MEIKISPSDRKQIQDNLKKYFEENFDEEIGELKTGFLLDFMITEVGPAIYNSAIKEASSYIQTKLLDLEDEFFIPEKPEDS